MEAGEGQSGGTELERLTVRLGQLADELEAEPEEKRAAELVREASDVATQVGQEVDRALRAAAETPER